jgi:hypothetical protein
MSTMCCVGKACSRSQAFVSVIVLIETLFHIPLILISIFIQAEQELIRILFSSTITAIAVVVAVSGWMTVYSLAHDYTTFLWHKVSQSHVIGAFCAAVTLLHSVMLLKRIWIGECPKMHTSSLAALQCNPYASSDLPPIDSVVLLMTTPFLLASIVEKGNLVNRVVISWVITMITLALSWYMLNSVHFASTFFIYATASILIIGRNYCRTMKMQAENQNLTNIIEENKLLLEETKATEMRHMIANVAHDLKTVSISIFCSRIFYLTKFYFPTAIVFFHVWHRSHYERIRYFSEASNRKHYEFNIRRGTFD